MPRSAAFQMQERAPFLLLRVKYESPEEWVTYSLALRVPMVDGQGLGGNAGVNLVPIEFPTLRIPSSEETAQLFDVRLCGWIRRGWVKSHSPSREIRWRMAEGVGFEPAGRVNDRRVSRPLLYLPP